MTDAQTTARTDPAPITPADPGSTPGDGTPTRDEASEVYQTAGEPAVEGTDVDEDSQEPAESIATEEEAEEEGEHLDPAAESRRLAVELAEAVRRVQKADAASAKLRAEAQQLRSRLRAAESERDVAVTEAQDAREAETRALRQRVDVTLCEFLADPADAWAGGLDVANLIDADGAVDVAAVEAAARKLITEHPHWQRTDQPIPPRFNPGSEWRYPLAFLLRNAKGGVQPEQAARMTLGEVIQARASGV